MLKKIRPIFIDQEYIKYLFGYDKHTGIFTRNISRSSNAIIGDVVGTELSGYLKVTVFKKPYLLHRLAWLYIYGEFPKNEIDHIDGNKKNNAISNLRCVTSSQNKRNMPIPSHNTSSNIGVSFDKSRNKWMAFATIGGKFKNFGRFDNKIDAIKARKKANKEYGFHENHGRLV